MFFELTDETTTFIFKKRRKRCDVVSLPKQYTLYVLTGNTCLTAFALQLCRSHSAR